MVRDLVLDAQAAKPPVGQIHLHLAAQQPLRANGEHVAEDKHSDHKNRINRGAAKVGVVGRQLTVHPRQVQHSSDLAHAMIAWDDVLKAERIEQLPLVVFEPPHHRQPPLPRRILRGESRFAAHGNRLLQQNLPQPDSCTATKDLSGPAEFPGHHLSHCTRGFAGYSSLTTRATVHENGGQHAPRYV